jgi:putative component of membrane protein insertase Oxa1/YidC/SpoIIIJ protein YidD
VVGAAAVATTLGVLCYFNETCSEKAKWAGERAGNATAEFVVQRMLESMFKR